MDKDEFRIVEDNLCRNQYPNGILKEDKGANAKLQVAKAKVTKKCAKIKDTFSSHVMLGLKVKEKVYLL